MFPQPSPFKVYGYVASLRLIIFPVTRIPSAREPYMSFRAAPNPSISKERRGMGEGMYPTCHGSVEGDDDLCGSVSFSSDSWGSVGSSLSSSDLTDDANSSPPTSSPPLPPATSPSCDPQLDASQATGPLYECSSLMAQLPIKRGLSKFFSGKSQSFTLLSNVRCVEDLAKKETPYRRKIKASKSYAGMLDLTNKSYFTPGPHSKTILKKSSRGSCASLAVKRSNRSLFGSSKPPPVPVQKNM